MSYSIFKAHWLIMLPVFTDYSPLQQVQHSPCKLFQECTKCRFEPVFNPQGCMAIFQDSSAKMLSPSEKMVYHCPWKHLGAVIYFLNRSYRTTALLITHTYKNPIKKQFLPPPHVLAFLMKPDSIGKGGKIKITLALGPTKVVQPGLCHYIFIVL